MRSVEVTRYYSIGKDYGLEEALKRLDQLQERHPDREYQLWYNTRAFYKRVTVVQVRRVTVQVPEEGRDYTLLPEPVQKPGQSYGDWTRELKDWRDDCARRKGPDPFDQISGSLN
jgi:hypothetical protein